jgi:transposase
MRKEDFMGIFTPEQLNNMSRENMLELLKIQQNQKLQLENKLKLAEEKLREAEFMNALLSEKLALAQHKRFGASSEKHADGYEQMNLFNEAEANASLEDAEPTYEEIHPSSYKRKKAKGKKENDLSIFPVERVEYRLSGQELFCEDCGKKMKVVTTETHRYLKLIPAQFVTVEEIVFVYSCPVCNKMKRAHKKPSLLKGSIATPSLVAGIMNAKYVNGVPLYRQEQEFKRYDLILNTKTMANWMIRCSEDYLYPIYDRMKAKLILGHYTHCDETRCQVLDEPDQKAETKNWMWVYMTDELSGSPQMVIFQYERTRGGYHPREFLKDYHGFLTTDGYQPYHSLPASITVTGCMAHARRRFDECLTILKKDLKNDEWKNSIAYEAVCQIGKLYKIEDEIRDKSCDERLKVRQEKSKPILDAYFAWLHSMDTEDLDHKSKIGDAILYSLRQEPYLRVYLEDGHLSIDNNACERSIKGFALGRRAWLFCKSIQGAEASAVIYSIVETAKLNGLRPHTYLTYVLDTMRCHQEDTDYSFIDDLLPWSPKLPDTCKLNMSKN